MKFSFKRKKTVVKKPEGETSSLYRVLSNSYAKKDKQSKSLEKEGYTYDHELSNHNQQVYYHPHTKKMVYAVTGTHNLKDVGTDVMLGAGRIKKTKRYKEAESTYAKAREKYNPEHSTVTGHSLGGAIASKVGKGSDNIVTYNKGATIGEKRRKNETSIHTRGDPISMFSKSKVNLKSKKNAHSTDHLKHTDFTI